MTILEIKDVVRKDVPIYYRRLFTGTAVIELLGDRLDRRIEFSIETKPTGAKETTVNLLDDVEYPLIPLVRGLKELVAGMDASGALP